MQSKMTPMNLGQHADYYEDLARAHDVNIPGYGVVTVQNRGMIGPYLGSMSPPEFTGSGWRPPRSEQNRNEARGLLSDYLLRTMGPQDWMNLIPQGDARPAGTAAQPPAVQPMTGVYGGQAARMAGLLAQPAQPTPSQPAGLFGGRRTGFRIPGK